MGSGSGMDPVTLLMLSGFASVGGFMRGFAGTATTLLMVPLFSLVLVPAEAVLLGVLFDVVYSFIRMSLSAAMIAYAGSFGPGILVKTGFLLPAMLAATWIGTRALRVVSERAFRRTLLVVLAVLGIALVIRTATGP